MLIEITEMINDTKYSKRNGENGKLNWENKISMKSTKN